MAAVKKMIQLRAYNRGLITQNLKLIDSLSDEQVNVLLLDDCIHKLESNLVIVIIVITFQTANPNWES